MHNNTQNQQQQKVNKQVDSSSHWGSGHAPQNSIPQQQAQAWISQQQVPSDVNSRIWNFQTEQYLKMQQLKAVRIHTLSFRILSMKVV